jgi:short-subunit dehydrogenase
MTEQATTRTAGATAPGAGTPVALITGASAGLGASFARRFAADGHHLVLTARRADRLEALAAELRQRHGVDVDVVVADLATPDGPAAVVAELERRGRRVGFLVNNAGLGTSGPLHTVDPEAERSMLAVNVSALAQLTRLLLPGMLARDEGRILHVGSTAGYLPGPYMASYYASKAFVDSFARALAAELRGTSVTSTLLCPGPTRTEFDVVAGVGDSRLFSSGTMDADTVVAAGYRGLMRGRAVIIPGLRNKLNVLALAVTPKVVSGALAGRLNQPRR